MKKNIITTTGIKNIDIKKVFENKNLIKLILHRRYSSILIGSKSEPCQDWVVSEYYTGRAIESGRTMKEAVERTEKLMRINKVLSVKTMEKKIKKLEKINK
jgi:hypothetical protein